MNTGTLFVVSAPSGAGKTSLVSKLVESRETLEVSVSHTTRPMRPGEENGKHYHFVSKEAFQADIGKGHFLEHAEVFGNFYGTSHLAIEEKLSQGIDVILEIDWQGAEQVRRLIPDCLTIFIVPPSLQELRKRLEGRASDAADVIERRLAEAQDEMSHYAEFDYLVVNDDFDHAFNQLDAIFEAVRLEMLNQQVKYADLLQNLLARD
jgi:guanylate kinase